jgi:hypothetical protein
MYYIFENPWVRFDGLGFFYGLHAISAGFATTGSKLQLEKALSH